MEEGSKRRLVGTAVVVVLLVIFLPMLLEEEVTSPVPESDLDIPTPPHLDEELDPTLAEPPAEVFQVPNAPELPPPEAPALSIQPELPAPEVAEEPSAAREPEEESAAPAPPPEPVAATPAVSPPPPQASESPRRAGELASWVIQVAALAERARAESLQQDLRAKGFPAFVEKAVVRGKTYHRIRVGPEADRGQIEAMATSLREKTGFKGQILRYP